MTRPKILIIADWFAPGYKAGGPIQSCVNFAYLMRENYDIYVYTSDRDLNENQAYPNIQTDTWLPFDDHIFVYYFSPKNKTKTTLKNQILQVAPQYLYLNSLIAPYFAVLPLVLHYLDPFPLKIVLAPRGMLKSSALQYKSIKKITFLKVARWIGLVKNVAFHATDDVEAQNIKQYFPKAKQIEIINNPPRTTVLPFKTVEKTANNLKLLFVGRIHPIKNLAFLLNVLSKTTPSVNMTLSIIAQIEDPNYWTECQQIIARLPKNIVVNYLGSIPNTEIDDYIQNHHLSVQPTFGENFGHAIFESFLNGRPVLISNQTPWRNLESLKIGWDIPLVEPNNWVKMLETIAATGQNEFDEWCNNCRRFLQAYIQNSNIKTQYTKLFS